jgi:Dyp-type peroxidase family
LTELDFPNIQGFVVRGYRLPAAGYLFLRIDSGARAREFLGDFIPQVITAERWDAKPESGINIAFSYAGLRALGVADVSLAGFPAEFRDGMASRAELLGDVGESAPERWEDCFRSGDAHVLVMISAKDPAALAERDQRIRELVASRGGASVVVSQLGGALPTGREHFGYADGFSQPAIEGSRFEDHPGAGAPKDGGWRPIAAGEFILGYRDEQAALPAAPPPDELSRNGAYVVYRKLRQDVAAFRRQLREAAALYPGGEELLAAKLVGRWRDGTPLDSSPHAPDAGLVADKSRNNAFDYGRDPDGLRCPIGSHIRRMNPRLSMPFEGKLVNRHRIIRRGITYGDLLPEGVTEDDGKERGVIFMTVQANLARQFEFVQAQWANTGNPFRLGDDQDPIIGPQDSAPAKMTIPGRPPFFAGPLSRVVTMRGGEYYFAPGINGLRNLSAG